MSAIPNNYDGKLAGDVWDSWTKEQKEHFLADHLPDEENIFGTHKYIRLPLYVQKEVMKHVSRGQYEKGGKMPGYISDLTYFIGHLDRMAAEAANEGKEHNISIEIGKQAVKIPFNADSYERLSRFIREEIKESNELGYEKGGEIDDQGRKLVYLVLWGSNAAPGVPATDQGGYEVLSEEQMEFWIKESGDEDLIPTIKALKPQGEPLTKDLPGYMISIQKVPAMFSSGGSMAAGGRSKAAIAKDRKYTSSEPHELAYDRKGETRHYKTKNNPFGMEKGGKTGYKRFKEGMKARVDEAYLRDEASPGGASAIATIMSEPSHEEDLVMIRYEDGSIDHLGQEWLEPIEGPMSSGGMVGFLNKKIKLW